MICLSRGLWGILCVGIAIVAATAPRGSSAQDAASRVDFKRDVAPVLQQQCVDCHGPDMQMADLRLDQRRFVLGDEADPDLVKAGKSAESLLIRRLVDAKLGLIMPPTFPFPPGEKLGLPEATIQVLKSWIDQGAQWPDGLALASDGAGSAENAKVRALVAAIREGNHKIAAELLSSDKELVDALDRYGQTPLMHAGVYSDAAMVKLLLAHGADVNFASRDGATALMLAAGDFDKVELLLARGAKLDAKSNIGRTPLLIAAAFPGNVKTVRLLLAQGAKINDQDKFGETCLTSASKRGDVEMVKALIEAGADVTAGASWPGQSPLIWAAEEGNRETLACLLDHGAGKVQPHLDFALSTAARRGSLAAVRLLMERGANPNTPSPLSEYTPLMWAAYCEVADLEIVRLLLAKGADPKAKGSDDGETALSLAKRRGSSAVVELLEGKPGVRGQESVVRGQEQEVVSEERIRTAAEKSLELLQKCGPTFFVKSGCVACHQQSVTSLAVAEARKRGVKVDEKTAREQIHVTAQFIKTTRERFLERSDHPGGSAPTVGYFAVGLGAENYPPDEITDGMIIELAGRQQLDGSWTAFSHRPPLEYSRISATALAIRAMQLYGLPGLKAKYEKQIERGAEWLAAAQPAATSDHAFRLLGLAWVGRDAAQVKAEVNSLLKSQNKDGGWSEQPGLDSDAYATGLALYGLSAAGGLASTDQAYQRGVAYLLRTQHADGSWHVKTRSFAFQPYFESGFPHGHDQWISAAATGFAAVALMQALPPNVQGAQ